MGRLGLVCSRSESRRIGALSLRVIIAPDTPRFCKWFRQSRVVDTSGRPLVMFHGTASPAWTGSGSDQLDRFGTTNGMGEGAYFTPNLAVAEEYARMDDTGDGFQAIIPVFLSVQNPKVFHDSIDSQSITPAQKAQWMADGHDGVFGVVDGRLIEVAIFDPRQAKSAIGNCGRFSRRSEALCA